MKKLMMLLVAVLIVGAMVMPANAYAIFWLLGCSRSSDPFNGVGGHWETRPKKVYSGCWTAQNNCNIGCGEDNGGCYYMVNEEVWVPDQGGCIPA